MDKYVQAARLRIRELEAASKMSKRELRRARKTIKTYELLAVLNDGRLPAKDATATGTLGSTFIQTQPAQPAPPPQVGSLRRECPQGRVWGHRVLGSAHEGSRHMFQERGP